ncbi:MAG: 3-oxoacyl-ACP reductase, partial [Micromonosporaceae bacterium]|nr:3-oxoacyl-ACP reductase [Micromonosporaceae bacterium]
MRRDLYSSFATSGPGRVIVRGLGLPSPPRLRRYRPGQALVAGPVLVGGEGRLVVPVRKLVEAIGAELGDPAGRSGNPPAPANAALVFDATAIGDSTRLSALYDFFHPYARTLRPSGRIVLLGTAPEHATSAREATAQRALEGFVKAVGKEVGRGSTAQLVYVAPGAEDAIESTMRFLLSAKSAYVSGQVIRIGPAPVAAPDDWEVPLRHKVALVTGAALGIGAATARVLARDGAHVVCLDLPSTGAALGAVVDQVAGTAFPFDVAEPDAPERLAEHLQARHGAIDIVVHNAGVTRDRTLSKMSLQQWHAVLEVNLSSQERINDRLLGEGVVREGGRMVSIASLIGVAGNRGQTNYATSAAGVAGLVASLAPDLAARGVTINAVTPGFIESATAPRMPLLLREAGRRMNSMGQGGLPVDVAEAVAYLANPGSAGVTGNMLAVCGLTLL